MARPTKLTKDWLKVAEKVINDDINAIILTDEELVFEINDRVEEDARISNRTFQRWKRANKGEDEEEDKEELDEMGKSFVVLIKRALLKQKKHLFDKFREEPNQWQRWAWIIERKFDDWNIQHKTKFSGDKENPIPILNVLSDNDSDKKDKEAE